jgi:DDE family transposase
LRTVQYIVTPAAVHRLACGLLLNHLALRDFGRTCPAATLLSVVFKACARLTSLFAACAGLARAPSPETARQALLANLPGLAELQRRLNDALAACVPAPLRRHLRRRRRPLGVAVDLHLRPYHGRPQQDPCEIYRGQAKSGTTHFHAYATAYLVRRGQRFTLAMRYVLAGDPLERVVRELLARCAQIGAKAGLVLVDRAFWTVDVIRYLQAARYPFLMPVITRGKKTGVAGGPSGTRSFQYWARGGLAGYTLAQSGGGRQATVGIAVYVRYRRGRRGRRGRERLAYAYWGWAPASARAAHERYRLRFGIETSYRQLGEGKARTCSRSPAVRLFLVGVALLLRNVWVWLHWEVLARRRRGPRRLRLEALRLKALLEMLEEVADDLLGPAREVRAQRPIPDRLSA